MNGEEKRGMAASPEDALARVREFSRLPAVSVFCSADDVNLMADLTGEFFESPGVDIDSYTGFVPTFALALATDNRARGSRPAGGFPYSPRVSNALVLLGLMLLDHAKGRTRRRNVTDCLQMTLGQYLDAVGTLIARKGEERGDAWTEEFRTWRDIILQVCDRDLPLAKGLNDVLACYVSGWKLLRQADYVLWCAGCQARQEERENPEGAEAARRFLAALDQYGIFTGPEDLPGENESPEPGESPLDWARRDSVIIQSGGDNIPAGAMRSQIFLDDRDYGMESWQKLTELCPFPEFRSLLEEHLSPENLERATGRIGAAGTDLYMLWVEPYLRLGDLRTNGQT